MAKTSPTKRSLDYLRKLGFTCCITEKWNAFARQRFDAYGFGDILAIRPAPTPMIALVQTTTKTNMPARRDKILAEPRAKIWQESGGVILLHGWRKLGPRGKRKLWEVDEERIPTI